MTSRSLVLVPACSCCSYPATGSHAATQMNASTLNARCWIHWDCETLFGAFSRCTFLTVWRSCFSTHSTDFGEEEEGILCRWLHLLAPTTIVRRDRGSRVRRRPLLISRDLLGLLGSRDRRYVWHRKRKAAIGTRAVCLKNMPHRLSP